MNKVYLWLADVAIYAKSNSLDYKDVLAKVIDAAKNQGYDCREEWKESVMNSIALKGISLEVDDIDGLCISAGIDESYFTNITVETWLSYG